LVVNPRAYPADTHLTLIAAAPQSGQAGLARALITERAARKAAAAPSARALVLAKGGDETWLAW
jgi:hypothetical protein